MFEDIQTLLPDIANFSDIFDLVLNISNELLSTKPDRLNLLAKKLKPEILQYIRKEKRTTISKIAKRFNIDPVLAKTRVFVAPAATSDMVLELVYHDLPQLIESKPIKLIAVDSLTSTFRAEYVGLESLRERQQMINKLLHFLLRLAIAEKIAVVITNQVIAQTNPYGPSMIAAGGFVVGHMSTYRVQLRRKGSEGGVIAKLEDAPDLPEQEVPLRITDNGIIDD